MTETKVHEISKVEEIEEVEEVSKAAAAAAEEEEVPSLENIENMDFEQLQQAAAMAAEMEQRSGKHTKQYTKYMAKLGLKPEPNINRISVRKGKELNIFFKDTDVFRYPNSNTFVFFGTVSTDNPMLDTQRAAARTVTEAMNPTAAKAPAAPAKSKVAAGAKSPKKPKEAAEKNKKEEEEKEEEIDKSKFGEDEIKAIMETTSTTRARAIKALNNNNGDVVNSIMEIQS